MIYFVTGASGFIGKRLVRTLLARSQATVYFLMRDASPARVEVLRKYWHATAKRAIPLKGDINQPGLGLSKDDIETLKNRVDHFFHLAAIYDLNADPEKEMATNIEGTRNAVRLAETIGARRFHHFSSIAAAGLYEGTFREDMFEQARHLDHPYFASKHESEKVVRQECSVPWRIYRPGIVVGDSETGEMDKIDGPYYFFGLIKRMRAILPPWLPVVGIESGRINLVPVDFVVAAVNHIAHAAGQDGKCFHLTDPHPYRVGDVLAMFAKAGHAPDIGMRLNLGLLRMLPAPLVKGLSALPVLKRLRTAVMRDLKLPDSVFTLLSYPTRFDNREAASLLEPAGIRVPRLEDYAWKLWDYWERHLDPALVTGKTLHAQLQGKVVLITGGSSGIGKAAAFKLAEAGAKVLIAARDPEKLEAAKQEAAARGLTLIAHAADITDPDRCAALAKWVLEEHGGADILINNAGRSIRRGIAESIDRMHDFERTMQLNYFASVRLTLALLPKMTEKGDGHVINISSIGVLTERAPLLRLCRLESGARSLDALRCRGILRARRAFHRHKLPARAHAHDLAHENLRSGAGAYARAGGRHDRRGHRQPANAPRHGARFFRAGRAGHRPKAGADREQPAIPGFPGDAGEKRRWRRARNPAYAGPDRLLNPVPGHSCLTASRAE